MISPGDITTATGAWGESKHMHNGDNKGGKLYARTHTCTHTHTHAHTCMFPLETEARG